MMNSIPSHNHYTLPLSLTHTHMQPPPQLKPFNVEQFLKGMEGAGPHLTSGIKGNWAGLYRYIYIKVYNVCGTRGLTLLF